MLIKGVRLLEIKQFRKLLIGERNGDFKGWLMSVGLWKAM